MTNQIAWLCLILAIITEVLGITSMKLSEGFIYPIPSLCIFIFYGLSLFFLSSSLKRLEVGFAYAIWSALGTLLIFIIGVSYFHEPWTIIKVMSIAFIVIGVVGLKQA